MYSKKDDGK